MVPLNSALVSDWLLGEMVAHGLLKRHGNTYVFTGEQNDFIVDVTARPFKKNVRLKESYDFGDDDNRGYN